MMGELLEYIFGPLKHPKKLYEEKNELKYYLRAFGVGFAFFYLITTVLPLILWMPSSFNTPLASFFGSISATVGEAFIFQPVNYIFSAIEISIFNFPAITPTILFQYKMMPVIGSLIPLVAVPMGLIIWSWWTGLWKMICGDQFAFKENMKIIANGIMPIFLVSPLSMILELVLHAVGVSRYMLAWPFHFIYAVITLWAAVLIIIGFKQKTQVSTLKSIMVVILAILSMELLLSLISVVAFGSSFGFTIPFINLPFI